MGADARAVLLFYMCLIFHIPPKYVARECGIRSDAALDSLYSSCLSPSSTMSRQLTWWSFQLRRNQTVPVELIAVLRPYGEGSLLERNDAAYISPANIWTLR
jgi:hypothetical protein